MAGRDYPHLELVSFVVELDTKETVDVIGISTKDAV
jgi:hypothetical protein